jgi:hypothetical protein
MKPTAVLTSVLLVGLLAYTKSDEIDDNQLLVNEAANVAKLHRITEEPFKMDAVTATLCRVEPKTTEEPGDPHGSYYCHIYINDAGQKTMETGEGTYPVGTIVIKQKFTDRKAKNVELYTLMRKMESGYDPEHGDWEYSIINRTAKKVLSRGKTDSCIACHQQYAALDYVSRLYLPLLE